MSGLFLKCFYIISLGAENELGTTNWIFGLIFTEKHIMPENNENIEAFTRKLFYALVFFVKKKEET